MFISAAAVGGAAVRQCVCCGCVRGSRYGAITRAGYFLLRGWLARRATV